MAELRAHGGVHSRQHFVIFAGRVANAAFLLSDHLLSACLLKGLPLPAAIALAAPVKIQAAHDQTGQCEHPDAPKYRQIGMRHVRPPSVSHVDSSSAFGVAALLTKR